MDKSSEVYRLTITGSNTVLRHCWHPGNQFTPKQSTITCCDRFLWNCVCISTTQNLQYVHRAAGTYYREFPDVWPWIPAYSEWLHIQGGCLACLCCKVDSSWGCTDLYYALGPRRSGGTVHEGGWCDQSIGSTVSGAIVHSWLWSTPTRKSPLGYFTGLLEVVDNYWRHILC